MWEGLLNSIRQMGVFMICAQALIHFKPKGSYEKYLKLLVSAMILVQILSPVAALLSGGEGQSLEERIAIYSNSFEQGLGEAAVEEYRIEQLQRSLLEAQMEASDIPRQEDSRETEAEGGTRQDSLEETENITIQIDPVVIEMPWDGAPDMGRREDEHGGENEKPDDKVAAEG